MGFKRLNIGIASPLRIHRCALDAPLTRQEFPHTTHRVLRRAHLAKRTPLVLRCERFIANSFLGDDFVIAEVQPNAIAAQVANISSMTLLSRSRAGTDLLSHELIHGEVRCPCMNSVRKIDL